MDPTGQAEDALDGFDTVWLLGTGRTVERCHCSSGLGTAHLDVLRAHGLRFTGHDEDGAVRIAELPWHPFFLGHPVPARTRRRRRPGPPDRPSPRHRRHPPHLTPRAMSRAPPGARGTAREAPHLRRALLTQFPAPGKP
ncbi:hypothetical protein [Saccharothrix sp. ST-888]|uniref:hypothetical protein n=1 Tax=Saccharothrix sp. ST-888 TaxID=1427391 RepID=UPI000ADDCEA3|nr:hypothetical protein [Saccharothrix sp. ST-888]